MTIAYIEYPLADGFIDNWLVAGPAATLVDDVERYRGEDWKAQITRQHYQAEPGVGPAAEMQPVTIGERETRWEYARCREDHFVDLSQYYQRCHYLRAWAYCEVVSPAEQRVTLVLTTNGPADVWLNEAHVHRHEHFAEGAPESAAFDASLGPGANRVLIRIEQIAVRECPYVAALHVTGESAAGLGVRLPTTILPVEQRRVYERTFAAAHVRQDVFHARDELAVYWPDDFHGSAELTIRLQTQDRYIYLEGDETAQRGARVMLGQALQFPDGAYDLFFMPRPQEYYLGNMRVERKLRCRVISNSFSTTPYSSLPERSREALLDAARREGNVFSEIAKMALGAWQRVKAPVLRATIESINRREDDSGGFLVGLLGTAYRYGQNAAYPEELKQPLHDCILGFRYWHDEPGSNAMCFTSESDSILFHTCELLAGQLYPDRVFSNSGETGQQHRAKGEQRALAWLRDRAARGFREWDSNYCFEQHVLALSHLLSLAENDDVAALAAVVLDKLLFSIAVNSFRGVFGSTHGRSCTPCVKSAYNEATSGMTRLLWGMGVFNSHVLATVSLACSDYTLPSVIADIAADLPEELWNRERHTGELSGWQDGTAPEVEVNKVTYKTPDYMLSSAQDWRPGERGDREHIWQATLGPDAPVFVTHPACAGEEDVQRPNFWLGNATLPRVAQWKDVLIGVYNLPQADWMGFTHAFFPAFAFDEYYIAEGWAWARVGNGYIALTAARGLDWLTAGENAYRELRSYGQHNIWFCHMGRRAQDGSFEEFRQKTKALPIQFSNLAVTARSLRGDEIAFGWQGPLLLNGAEQPITGFKHYENPYCVAELPASRMEIGYQDTLMRLQFADAGDGR